MRRARIMGVVVALVVGMTTTVVGLTTTAARAAVSVYPVATSAAGLGRIVTAPNGDMWFTMEDVNKVGRITPAGAITEYALPPVDTGVPQGQVVDLDVAADGTVWVIFDHGSQVVPLSPSGAVGTPVQIHSSRPYGKHVRVGADGVPWVSISYDIDGIARIIGGQALVHPNMPPCDREALGRAVDGAMWCTDSDSVIRVNADGSGGQTYPLPTSSIGSPRSLAAGPVGSIWFTRYFPGTWTSSPSRGDIGFLDQATGQATVWNTGSRTAPRSLVQGPGGVMWFVSVGAAKGIGHLTTAGTGRLTQVGGYQATALTVGPDGAIWFTDETNNAVVRVTTDELQVTNVDPGEGSVLVNPPSPSPTPPPPPAPVQAGQVKAGKKPLKVRKQRVRLPVTCPAAATSGCRGTALLRSTAKKRKPLTRAGGYRLAPGASTTVRLRLTKAGRRAVRPRRAVKVLAELRLAGSSKPSVRVRVRIRR